MRWVYGAALALALTLAAAAACNGNGEQVPTPGFLPSPDATDEEAAREAFLLVERLLDEGDAESLYDIYTDSFRAECPRERFLRAIDVFRKIKAVLPGETVEVVSVVVLGEEATVAVERTIEGEEPQPDQVTLVKSDGRWFFQAEQRFVDTCLADVLENDLTAEAYGGVVTIFTPFLNQSLPEAVRDLYRSGLTDRFRTACPDEGILFASLNAASVDTIFQLAALLWEPTIERGLRVEFKTPIGHPQAGVLAVAVVKQPDGQWLVDAVAGITEC